MGWEQTMKNRPFTKSGKSNRDSDYILILFQISYQESEKKSVQKNKTSKILQIQSIVFSITKSQILKLLNPEKSEREGRGGGVRVCDPLIYSPRHPHF